MRPCGRLLWLVAWAAATQPCAAQQFVYVEAGNAACPAVPAASASAPATVVRGAAVAGSLRVRCGFAEGSYTLNLNSTDPAATFSPRSFLVNFGRLVGNGAFTTTFSTPGLQSVSVAITSNMGSPAVSGRFVSAASEFRVVSP